MHRLTRGTWFDDLAGVLEKAGMDVSPETLKHLWQTATGGSGKFVTDTGNAIKLKADGVELETGDLPIVRDFYKVPDIKGSRANYYEAREDADRAIAEYNRAIQAKNYDQARAVMEDKRELIVAAKIAQAWDKMVKATRDREDAVRLSGKYTQAEERAILKQMEREEAAIYEKLMQTFKEKKQEMKERKAVASG